ncbi:MAG: hypothetical protein M3Q37_12680 [Gemmatimonadota bacterium]|nr:hypothetical protein [Gemmatimonadota bacterium]
MGLHLEGDRFKLPCGAGPRHRGIPAVFSSEEHGSSGDLVAARAAERVALLSRGAILFGTPP